MKKRKINSLALNKTKISQLDQQQQKGAGPFTTDQLTISTCTCVSCADTCQGSFVVCPPPETQFCTVDCQTLDCTFVANCETVFCTVLP
jgi:hypothetical protein